MIGTQWNVNYYDPQHKPERYAGSDYTPQGLMHALLFAALLEGPADTKTLAYRIHRSQHWANLVLDELAHYGYVGFDGFATSGAYKKVWKVLV